MLKNLAGVISILMIVGLNWIGISKVFGTYAMFSDSEISESGAFTAGTLDLSVSSTAFSLTLDAAAATASSTIDIADGGSIPFAYRLKTSAANSAGGLCDQLVLAAALDDATSAFTGPLSVFETDEILITAGQDRWTIFAALPPDADLNAFKGTNCEFTIDADAKQPGLPGWTRGFTDVGHIFGAISVARDAGPPLADGNGLRNFVSGEGDATKLDAIEIIGDKYAEAKSENEIQADEIRLDSIVENDAASGVENYLISNASGRTAESADTGNAAGKTPANDPPAPSVVETGIMDNADNIVASVEEENDAGVSVPLAAEVQAGVISKIEFAPVPIGGNDMQDRSDDADEDSGSESRSDVKAVSELSCRQTGLAAATEEMSAEIIQATSVFSGDTES